MDLAFSLTELVVGYQLGIVESDYRHKIVNDKLYKWAVRGRRLDSGGETARGSSTKAIRSVGSVSPQEVIHRSGEKTISSVISCARDRKRINECPGCSEERL